MKKIPTTLLLLLFTFFITQFRVYAQSDLELKETAFKALKAKDYDKARSNFKLLIIQYPDSAKLLGMCYNNLGIIDIKEEFNARALENFEMSRKAYEQFGDDTLLAKSLVNNASIYKILGQYEQATLLTIRALKIFEKENRTLESAKASNTLGNIYKESNNLELALKYHNRAFELAKELNDSNQISKALNNRGSTFLEMEYFNQAASDFKQALKIKLQFENKKSIANTYYNLGELEFLRSNLDSSIYYFNKSLTIRDSLTDKRGVAYCYNYLGSIYTLNKQWKKAATYLGKALKLASYLKLDDLRKKNYKFQQELYEQQGDLKKALLYHKHFTSLRDSLLDHEKQKTINELEIKYEVDKKQKENLLLSKEAEINLLKISQQEEETSMWQRSAVIVGVIALFILLLVIQYYKLYNKEKLLSAKEKQLTIEQHHRIKNHLQTLAGLLSFQQRKLGDEVAREIIQESKNRVAVITLLHESFYSKKITEGTTILFNEYLNRMIQNLVIVFGKQQIELMIELESIYLDTDKALPLGLIANEIITNAFKYGTSSDKPVLKIVMSAKNNVLKLVIADNGSGMIPHNNESIGLELINQLIKQMDGKIEVNSVNGTEYSIKVPV
jgi:two-component sensor histidine kinase/TolA-binding protein